jgi:nuclear protein localization family protein 4
MKNEPLNRAGGRHSGRSTAGENLSGDLEWLCRHRPDQMCVNCAPLRKGEKVELEMLCLHGPEGRCTNCLPPDSTVDDRKFITYDEWMERRRAKCEHSFSATCVNCVTPSQQSFKMKPNCTKHLPWPKGLCSECAPTPLESKPQEYRHVDFISVANRDEMGGLISLVAANEAAGFQRAAFLYGVVVEDSNYRFGQRVIVEAMYEPPQRFIASTGAIVVLPDKRGKEVEALAAACGIKRIGWLFTKKPKASAKEAELSPRELFAMAQLQNSHPRSGGKPGSQFVTIGVRKGAAGYEPQGYMASDSIAALVRDGVLMDPSPADTMLKIKQPRPGTSDPPAPEFIILSKDWGRQRSTEMDPDAGTVTMEVAGPPQGRAGKFRHCTFPVENREDCGVKQSAAEVKKHLIRYKSEPLQQRLCDFHLLLFLATMFDMDTALMAAKAAVEDKAVPEGITLMLDDVTGGATA